MLPGVSLSISGYRHGADGPSLILDEGRSGAPSRRSALAIRGVPISLTWSSERSCVGYYDLATYGAFPCPSRARTNDDSTCADCTRRNGFNPSFYNVPQVALSPQQLVYNRQPHAVYLAAFAHDVIKVGISTERRVLTRLQNQGARRAVLVARCRDAYEARTYEDAIARTFSLPERLTVTRKLALLSEPFRGEAAAESLNDLRSRAQRELGLPARATPVIDFDRNYLGAANLEVPLAELTHFDPPSISGVGVGMIGDVLIVRESSRQYALPLKPLLGRTVRHEAVVRSNSRVRAGQLGFGF